MSKFFLLTVFCIFVFAADLYSQNSNCIKGDFPERFSKSETLAEAENRLCNEIRENPNLQATYGFVLSPKHGRIVRVYKNKTVFTIYEDFARYKERELTAKEIENFQRQTVKIPVHFDGSFEKRRNFRA